MKIRVEIEDRASEGMRQIAERELPRARRRLIERAMQQSLLETVRFNPVDTGRSRAAWVSAIRQGGWEPPADWQGPRPRGGAISEGSGLGSLSRAETQSETVMTASNAVRYVRFLEYGTRRMAPFAMVRRALAAVQARLSEWFRLSPR